MSESVKGRIKAELSSQTWAVNSVKEKKKHFFDFFFYKCIQVLLGMFYHATGMQIIKCAVALIFLQ